jgi:hypothetical protein
VLKKYKQDSTDQIRYGEQLHKAAEDYVTGVPLPPQFLFVKPTLDALMGKQGTKHAEIKMALTNKLQPCEWSSPDAWVRGIADLLILDEESKTAWVVDYKTGNNKYPDREQLKLMALMVFAHFPHIRKVNAALLFVVKNDLVKYAMSVDEKDPAWWDYRERIARIEQAFDTGVWNPRPSPLCPWCPVTTCEFHPRK